MKAYLLVILTTIIKISVEYCSNETCRRCCTVYQTGCYNSFDEQLEGKLVTDYTFCEDCDCSDPKIGCGWMGYNFGRVECASCDTLKSIQKSTSLGVVITGCGKVSFNGDLVFTPLPNPVYFP